ncbi:MAG: TonB-dependent receptor [Pseudohongiellaceae bacterium]
MVCIEGRMLPVWLAGALLAASQVASPVAAAPDEGGRVEEVLVLGERQLFSDGGGFSPVSRVDADMLERINMTTIEDGISYEPGLVVRRRFIGDPNGTLGMRGSNMFQGPRTMVFADGLPLHYHLQARWNSPPRWSLVAPDETESIDVVYGPFSAEYSGNAMGGVVNIQTRMPERETVTLEGAFFQQDYDVLSTDERYDGGRQFLAYGNRWGDLSVYTFYNRISNHSQPMDQYAGAVSPAQGGETLVTGAIPGRDSEGDAVMYFGDSGSESAVTNLYKTKAEYDLGRYTVRATVAYEERDRGLRGKNNFLTDERGEPVWGGTVAAGDSRFAVGGAWANPFALSEQERQSLLLGVGISGPLGDDDWYVDAFATDFDIRKDEERRSSEHPRTPGFDGSGRVVRHDGTGWQTADMKISREGFAGADSLLFSTGLHYSRYTLGVFDYTSPDYANGRTGSLTGASGGSMSTRAAYAQTRWTFADDWELGLGLRYEHWAADGGFIDDAQYPGRSDTAWSPKLSLGYRPAPQWQMRYSLARAVRFPVVEELFQTLDAGRTAQVSNPGLAPEAGVHHNLGLERVIEGGGLVRFNVFTESIDDVIFGQRGVVDGVDLNTFLPIDRVRTDGVELVWNQRSLFDTPLGVRFNVSHIHAKIERNAVNRAVEGKDFPRMPRWRANLLLDYQLTRTVEVSGGMRYASNQYNTMENSDTVSGVFGAMDSHRMVNLRANWAASERLRLSLGVDNVTNEEAYVHHPWPFRTVVMEAAYHY